MKFKPALGLITICVGLTTVYIWAHDEDELYPKLPTYGNYESEERARTKSFYTLKDGQEKADFIRLTIQNEKLKIKNNRKKITDIPVILLWNSPGVNKDHFRNDKFECEFTTDRSMLEKSSAVIISYRSSIRLDDLPNPKLRKPSQFFIVQFRETPSKYYAGYQTHRQLDHPKLNGIFNKTIYFRKDSDFLRRFGYYEDSLVQSYDNGHSDLSALMANKTKLAAWAVSNCDQTYGAKKRLEFGKLLMEKGLELETFGECFSNDNKDEDRFGFGRYKFYLAFENSLHCPDYVSEKFWKNSLMSGTVPIVYGPTREDVEAVAPPNSFIHVEDFDTPEELVKYIKYLDQNEEAYLEYHNWRTMPIEKVLKKLQDISYQVVKPGHTAFNDLCRKLLNKKVQPNTIRNITDWLFGKHHYQDELCLTPYKRSPGDT